MRNVSRSLSRLPRRFPLVLTSCALAAVLAGCTLGPDFVKPTPAAPDDWTAWHGGDESLKMPLGTGELRPDWWRTFGDPVLDRLEQRAFDASPDLKTAALRFAQARVQRGIVGGQQGPEVSMTAAANRQRLSENGAGSRVLRAIAGDQAAQPLIELVSEPFTLYQAGFDASWELDLWGRVRRSIEGADADVDREAALLEVARLSLASEVARNYFELRTAQQQIRLAREDLSALQQRLDLQQARVRGGLADHLDLDRQSAELAALKSQLPPLLAEESASANRIALLLGERPGALGAELQPPTGDARAPLPDLAAGLPSEVARRRPDIRAAEARLHRATANIGVGRADLYPSVRIGAHFGSESYLAGSFTDWGSRAWSIGPSLSLPLFDQGRRRNVVQLRELEQQEAAVAYQRTVLQAWQEVDDALSGYSAETQRLRNLEDRVRSARDPWELTRARYNAGTIDYTAVLDAQRVYLQARRDLATSHGRVQTRFVAINKAIGNAPQETVAVSQAKQ